MSAWGSGIWGVGGRSCNLLLRRHLVLSPVYNIIKVSPLGAPSFVNNLGVCWSAWWRQEALTYWVCKPCDDLREHLCVRHAHLIKYSPSLWLALIKNMEVNSASLHHVQLCFAGQPGWGKGRKRCKQVSRTGRGRGWGSKGEEHIYSGKTAKWGGLIKPDVKNKKGEKCLCKKVNVYNVNVSVQ